MQTDIKNYAQSYGKNFDWKLALPQKILDARLRIAKYISPTPCIEIAALTQLVGRPVWLKLETFCPTNSFKARPALNSILADLLTAQAKGVVTSSSGNFAQGVAWAAKELNCRAVVVMTETTVPNKIEATKRLGAEVVLCGPMFQDRWTKVEEIQKAQGLHFIHPFDSLETIAGDATVALELIDFFSTRGELIPDVVVPASGGGLIAGIAFALRGKDEAARVFGAQPEAVGALAKSHLSRTSQEIKAPKKTIADALTASIPGVQTLSIALERVNQFSLLSDDDFKNAVRFLYQQTRLFVEPGGAAGVAAVLKNPKNFHSEASLDQTKGQTKRPLVCVVTGGNVSIDRWTEIVS